MRLLTLIAPEEQIDILLKRGKVHKVAGHWDQSEADYRKAFEMAPTEATKKARAQFALGELYEERGDYALALEYLSRVKVARTALDDRSGLIEVLIEMGIVLWSQGEYASAYTPLNEALALAQATNNQAGMARSLINLGNVAYLQGDFIEARALYENSLALCQEMGYRWGIV